MAQDTGYNLWGHQSAESSAMNPDHISSDQILLPYAECLVTFVFLELMCLNATIKEISRDASHSLHPGFVLCCPSQCGSRTDAARSSPRNTHNFYIVAPLLPWWLLNLMSAATPALKLGTLVSNFIFLQNSFAHVGILFQLLQHLNFITSRTVEFSGTQGPFSLLVGKHLPAACTFLHICWLIVQDHNNPLGHTFNILQWERSLLGSYFKLQVPLLHRCRSWILRQVGNWALAVLSNLSRLLESLSHYFDLP